MVNYISPSIFVMNVREDKTAVIAGNFNIDHAFPSKCSASNCSPEAGIYTVRVHEIWGDQIIIRLSRMKFQAWTKCVVILIIVSRT